MAADIIADTKVDEASEAVGNEAVSVPSHDLALDEKIPLSAPDTEIEAASPPLDGRNGGGDDKDDDAGSEDVIIITGADAAAHLLPLRDDGEPALTFRSLFLATCLSAFQAVMSQIYTVR